MSVSFENRPRFYRRALFGVPALLSILSSLLLFGCYTEDGYPTFDNVGTVKGYRPVYASEESIEVKVLPARSPVQPGKIYIYNNYLFVNEMGQGVHVYDDSDPSDPQPLSFIRIPGNIDIAIKDNILYADNMGDLVALDVSNTADIRLVKRIKGVYPSQTAFPAQTGTYFECPDPKKGVVIGWEEATLENPKCYR